MNYAVELAPRHARGLRLQNPVMTASGTFGYGVEYAKAFDVQRLGAIVAKGITRLPRRGNPLPRLVETPAGLINSIGLQNVGLEALIREKAPVWARWTVPVIVNVAGESIEEFQEIAAALEGVPGVAGLELNISCPNVAAGGMEFGRDPSLAAEVTSAVKGVTTLPVIVKLTPNVSDITIIARAVEAAGADAISLINTLVGMAIDVERRRPVLGFRSGGLSGPAIKPVAVYMVYRVAQVVGVPVIGMGGISTAADALEFIMAGASAVQVGTASFVRPTAALDVLEGIERFMAEQGIQNVSELVGVAHHAPVAG